MEMNRRTLLTTLSGGLAVALGCKAIIAETQKSERTFFSVELGDKGDVFDALGNQIPRAIAIDTQTGWVKSFKLSEHGQLIESSKSGELATIESFHPAPIRYIPWAST